MLIAQFSSWFSPRISAPEGVAEPAEDLHVDEAEDDEELSEASVGEVAGDSDEWTTDDDDDADRVDGGDNIPINSKEEESAVCKGSEAEKATRAARVVAREKGEHYPSVAMEVASLSVESISPCSHSQIMFSWPRLMRKRVSLTFAEPSLRFPWVSEVDVLQGKCPSCGIFHTEYSLFMTHPTFLSCVLSSSAHPKRHTKMDCSKAATTSYPL
jgi:hypothetical protein